MLKLKKKKTKYVSGGGEEGERIMYVQEKSVGCDENDVKVA